MQSNASWKSNQIKNFDLKTSNIYSQLLSRSPFRTAVCRYNYLLQLLLSRFERQIIEVTFDCQIFPIAATHTYSLFLCISNVNSNRLLIDTAWRIDSCQAKEERGRKVKIRERKFRCEEEEGEKGEKGWKGRLKFTDKRGGGTLNKNVVPRGTKVEKIAFIPAPWNMKKKEEKG